ncbi:MAG: lysine exporter LysO family protein [Proteocatella sp.]
MTIMPFVCLCTGFFIGTGRLLEIEHKIVDTIVNSALFLLMFTIGLNIGLNEIILINIGNIGINCISIALLSIFFSATVTSIIERKFIKLDKIITRKSDINYNENSDMREFLMIPIFLILGAIIGFILLRKNIKLPVESFLFISLVLLYTGVGISLSRNRNIFKHIKLVGWKILLISITTFIGSFIAGIFAGVILNLPLEMTVLSASGMSYYSVTGAYMSQVYGAEKGIYGFLVNVFREFLVVLLLPLLSKFGKGGIISAGAAGNMDTMLVPVTKYTGEEFVLVTLITGTILTFAVPFILPILHILFNL